MANKCGACKETLRSDGIACFGICELQFHIRCSGINKIAEKALNENHNIKYVCDKCEQTSKKILINKIVNLIEKIENVKNNEDVQTNILKDLSTDMIEMKAIVKKTESEVKIIKSDVNKAVNNQETYADKVKLYKNDSAVIIKPKNDKQTSATTKTDVKEKIDPTQVPINGLRLISNGAVLLECTNQNAEQIKALAEINLGENYEIKVPEKIRPKLKIVGMSEKLDELSIVNNIKKQNAYIINSEIKVLHVNDNGKYRGISAIIEIDNENFGKMMIEKKVNIGWDRCYVYEYVNVRICYKCCGYNHIAQKCTREKACKKCGGNHDIKECNEDITKCINCASVNSKLNLKFDTNHQAGSSECKVYQRKMDIERKKISYNR